jgi:hypothetical protein
MDRHELHTRRSFASLHSAHNCVQVSSTLSSSRPVNPLKKRSFILRRLIVIKPMKIQMFEHGDDYEYEPWSGTNLKIRAACSSETSGSAYQTARRHIPNTGNLNWLKCIILLQNSSLFKTSLVKLRPQSECS